MLHPDFYKITPFITDLGFICGKTTNAMLIGRNAAQKLEIMTICSVGASLDGIEQSYDNSKKNSAFEKATGGIPDRVSVSKGKVAT